MSYPRQWKYKRIYTDELIKPPYYGSLDHLGAQGWELVAIGGNQESGQFYWFKRPLSYNYPK